MVSVTRFHVLIFRSDIVRHFFVDAIFLRENETVFTVEAEEFHRVEAQVGSKAVGDVCCVLDQVKGVHAVGKLCFEREVELEVFFNANVAGVGSEWTETSPSSSDRP